MAVVLIQGVMYSAASVNNFAFGVPVTGLVGIKWNRKQLKELQYNLGNEPIGVTYNQVAYEATLTVYKEWWQSVVNAAPDKDPLKIAPFDWTITYGNPGQQFVTEILKAFMFMEDGISVAAGDTKLTMDIACLFAGVERL